MQGRWLGGDWRSCSSLCYFAKGENDAQSHFDKRRMLLRHQSKETSDREFAKMHQLRSEQYTDISRRLRLALKEGDKRIEIK